MNASRHEIILWADDLLDNARRLAVTFTRCDDGTFVSAAARGWYYGGLEKAASLYRDAGLGLLAGRVEWLAKAENVRAAWAKFDRLNAGGCGVT